MAVAAILVGAAYLAWRVLYTVSWDVWWVSVPLFLLEVHAYIGLLLFIPVTWDLDAIPPARRVRRPEARTAILIPTYNEGTDILLPTVAAAIAVRLPHETWVLDDGDRPAVWELAQQLGASYLTRRDHTHAKAGNVNHALPRIDADFIVILDADHVAEPDLLEKTLGYFDDPKVALVQTPQDFYNLGSFEHFGARNEQNLFYRVQQPGKNRWNAAFWCGTGGVVRLSALRAVGGLATESITEDIHTTIRLHRAGWKTVYHNEPLAHGLAASTAEQYLSQRLRWGTGAMQVLRVDDPLFGRGLTMMQRICYLGTLFGWFDSWRTLGYVLVPLIVVATGANPLSAPFSVLLPIFVAQLLVQQYAIHRLSRGMATPFWSIVFEFSRLPATLAATLQRFSRRPIRFTVTEKGASSKGRRRVQVPDLLSWLLLATVAAFAWGGVNLLLPNPPLAYFNPWVVWGAMFWICFNGVFLFLASRRIAAPRFATEQRETVRFPVVVPAHWNDHDATVTNLSVSGAQLVLKNGEIGSAGKIAIGESGELLMDFATGVPPLRASVRTSSHEAGELSLGVEFLPGQDQARALLALALFRNDRRQAPPPGL